LRPGEPTVQGEKLLRSKITRVVDSGGWIVLDEEDAKRMKKTSFPMHVG